MSKGEQIKLVLKKNFHLNLVESSQGGSKLVSTSIIQYSAVYHLAQSKRSRLMTKREQMKFELAS